MKIVAKRKYKYPMGLEREYAKQIKGCVDDMFKKIRRFVPQMVALIKRNRINLDAEEGETNEDVARLMAELVAVLKLRENAEPYVRRMYEKVRKHSEKELREIFESLFGTSASLQGLRSEWTRNQIIREMSEEAEKEGIELTEEEKVAIGTGILLSEILSASEEKRKAIERIIRNRPAGADILASSEAEMVLKQEKILRQIQEIWTRENLDLVASIEAEELRKLRWKLTELIQGGVPEEELIDKLTEFLTKELGIEENRAVLIASDQVGKLNGRMMEIMQRAAGIEEYVWMTMMDERVREKHRERQGKVFRWDSPPPDGHPGIPIRCRCVANPLIDTDMFGVVPKSRTYIVDTLHNRIIV